MCEHKEECIKSTEYSIHTRRCFITGEYCSQQTNVQKERKKLHVENRINAFVIMNYSSMSDIVYESRIEPFIEGLKEHIYLNATTREIAVISNKNHSNIIKNITDESGWREVKKIDVHRADSSPVSNYIICNRVCQQIQTADLIVVDVSVESANVFYELGLAVAFNKFILPICFSESFYEMRLPQRLKEAIQEKQRERAREYNSNDSQTNGENQISNVSENADVKNLEKHIDCYPWRRKLFEYFGIRYQEEKKCNSNGLSYAGVRYLECETVHSEMYGFTDYQYNHFPYDEDDEKNGKTIGANIYNALKKSYNREEKMGNVPAYKCNTVVIYTMDGILNKKQVVQCIINYYENITKYMKDNYCFCGDRIAVLGQDNRIWDDPKDSKNHKELMYRVSDLIRIGMDKATYESERRRIKTKDYLEDDNTRDLDNYKAKAIHEIKTHIRNKCISLNPETPIYVIQYKEGIQEGVITRVEDKNKATNKFFCLAHVMIDTLRYVNEIVVDLTSNSIQSMFWLGVAHGANIPAITVRHEMIDKEKEWSGVDKIQIDRPIFDVGGLWTAMLRHDETKQFYKQLVMIQKGIEQNNKLKLSEVELEMLEENVLKVFYLPENKNSELTFEMPHLQRRKGERYALESFYRDIFWRHMLRENQLHIFLPMNDVYEVRGPRLNVIKWDIDAVAELSHYLSKRKTIGKYQFDTLRKTKGYIEYIGEKDQYINKENFISIGEQTKTFIREGEITNTLVEEIIERYKMPVNVTGRCIDICEKNECAVHFRGYKFKDTELKNANVKKQFVSIECISCSKKGDCELEILSEDRKTHFPDKIVIRLNGNSLIVELEPNENVLTRFRLRFVEHTKNEIRVLLYGLPYNEEKSITLQETEFLKSILKGVFPEGLIFKKCKDKSDFEGYYKIDIENNTNAGVSSELLYAFLKEGEIIVDKKNSKEITFALFNKNDSDIKKKQSKSENTLDFAIPAQLLLWREKNEDDIKYWVSLAGVSGPATKALTALLVDREQKKKILNKEIDDFCPLNELQLIIRKEFLDKYKDKLRNDGCCEDYMYLVENYLVTILYQFFLPFLSKSDEERIYNSLRAFLLMLDSNEYPDNKVDNSKSIDDVSAMKELKGLLKNFRGVEAFYEVNVTVKENHSNTDNREISSIKMWDSGEIANKKTISCLFLDSE